MTEPKANNAAGAADTATGYGKPLHARFRKGQSGNPAVRPRKQARLCAKQGRAAKRYNRVPLPIPPGLAARLKRTAEGRPEDAPLLVRPGYDRWISSSLRQPFAMVAKAAGCDPNVVTPNCLRHSSIVRQLINAVPIRVTAVRMIERSYSKHISDHSEALVRRALLDAVVVSDRESPSAVA
jgi:hypothetical protein